MPIHHAGTETTTEVTATALEAIEATTTTVGENWTIVSAGDTDQRNEIARSVSPDATTIPMTTAKMRDDAKSESNTTLMRKSVMVGDAAIN